MSRNRTIRRSSVVSTIPVLLAGLAFWIPSVASADRDLFSSVNIDSVYGSVESTNGSGSTNSDAETTSTTADRIRSVDHLGRLLRIEGFGFEKVGDRTFGASTKIDEWTFPTLVTLSPDGKSVGLILGLVMFEDSSKLTSEHMRELLVANQSVAPYQFSFSSQRDRTELAIVIPNEGVDSTRLSSEIEKLKKIGKDSSKIWFNKPTESSASTTQSPSSNQEPPSPQTTPSVQLSVSSLVGRWSCTKSSTEAFALEMVQDGSFKLVQVADGKTNVSTGTFGLRGTQLALTVPGKFTLAGEITMPSGDRFDLRPSGGNSLTFTRSK